MLYLRLLIDNIYDFTPAKYHACSFLSDTDELWNYELPITTEEVVRKR